MYNIFRIITSAITIYSFLCFIRIMFTWIPNLNYSKFGQFLSALCDPYLNIFRKLPLRIGMVDFSAIVAFGVLMLLSSITGNLSMGRAITLGHFLSLLLQLIWEIISSITIFLLIFMIIRLVVYLAKGDRGYSIWYQIDGALNPIIFRISSLIFGRRPVNFQTALITSIIIIFLIRFALQYLVGILCGFLSMLPI